MSDDTSLWDGPVGNKPLTDAEMRPLPTGQKPKVDDAKRLAWIAAHDASMARLKTREEKRVQEWKDLKENLHQEQQSDPERYTHIWVGRLNGTPMQTFKELTGQKVSKQNIIRVNDHKSLRGSRYVMSGKTTISPAMVEDVVMFRLTKTQATMAKLKRWNKEYQIDDADGSTWKGYYELVNASRLERDATFTNTAWSKFINAIEKLF